MTSTAKKGGTILTVTDGMTGTIDIQRGDIMTLRSGIIGTTKTERGASATIIVTGTTVVVPSE